MGGIGEAQAGRDEGLLALPFENCLLGPAQAPMLSQTLLISKQICL